MVISAQCQDQRSSLFYSSYPFFIISPSFESSRNRVKIWRRRRSRQYAVRRLQLISLCRTYCKLWPDIHPYTEFINMLFQIKILSYCELVACCLKKTNQVPGPTRFQSSVQCSFYDGCVHSRPFICLFLFLVKLFPNQWPWLKCKMTKEFSTREWIRNQRDFLSCQPNILCSKYSWCWTGRISVAVCAKWNSIISVLYEDEPGEGDPGQQRSEAAAQLVAQHLPAEASNPTSYGRTEEAS